MIICEETQSMNFCGEVKTNWFYSLDLKVAAQVQNPNLLHSEHDSFQNHHLYGF